MISALARRLGCTEGQLYTIVTGLLVASWLGLAGREIPPATVSANPSPATFQPGVIVPNPSGAPIPAPVAPVLPDLPVGALPTTAPDGSTSPSGPAEPPQVPSPTLPDRPVVFAMVARPGAPGGVAVAKDGHVFVGTGNGTARGVPGPSKILEYGGAGSLLSTTTIIGQQPDHAEGLGAVSVNPVDAAVYAIDVDTSRILRIDPVTRRQTTAVTLPDLAPCLVVLNVGPCEPGIVDHPPSPSALAFDDAGRLYAADAGQATIWRLRPGQQAGEPWYQSMDFATGDGPAGLAFANGSLQVSVGTSLDAANPQAGALYSLTIGFDGSAGARVLVAKFASGERPGPLAVDPVGVSYVILRGSGTIQAVSSGTARPLPTTGSPVPLDKPAALAVAGTRLLVANQAATNNPDRWAILSFPLVVES